MFWFKKKKINNEEAENKINTEEKSTLFENNDLNDEKESENINKDLNEEYYGENENDSESIVESEESEEASDNETEIAEISVKIKSLDDLAEFMNSRHSGGMQFMRVENNEAFEIKEYHLRLARVWGSVSMSRECTPEEYSRIMLAMELMEEQENFYVLPVPGETLYREKIVEFCRQKNDYDEKKFAKSPEKFAKYLKENGDIDEWTAFSKEMMYDLASDFCEKNGIEFNPEDTVNE